MHRHDAIWDGPSEARLACGFLREDVLEEVWAEAVPWPDRPELPQAIGRLRDHMLDW